MTRWTPERLYLVVRDPALDPIPLLLDALNCPDSAIREEAVRYLEEIPSIRAVAPLCELLLRDPEPPVRWQAAETLGTIGSAEAIPALIGATRDPNEFVRLNTAEALGGVGQGEPMVTEALCILLADSVVAVRIFALQSLADLGDRSALPALRTTPQPPAARPWASYAQARLSGGPFALAETLRILRQGGRSARLQAARVLPFVVTSHTRKRIAQALQSAITREADANLRSLLEHAASRLPPVLE